MKNIFILLVFIANIIVAQDTCESNEESFEDLNSITKCSIEPAKESVNNKQTRQISVKISASKKRYLKKRTNSTKDVATGINNHLNTNGISKTESSSDISKSLELKKQNSNTDSNIMALANNIAKETNKKAVKVTEISIVPKFEACKDAKKKNALACFNKEISKHIEEHFNYPTEAVINKLEGNVWVRFIIDQNGDVTNIKTLGPKGADVLNNEAKRVVSKLPKFIPGENNGEKTPVKYGFPISFSLEN